MTTRTSNIAIQKTHLLRIFFFILVQEHNCETDLIITRNNYIHQTFDDTPPSVDGSLVRCLAVASIQMNGLKNVFFHQTKQTVWFNSSYCISYVVIHEHKRFQHDDWINRCGYYAGQLRWIYWIFWVSRPNSVSVDLTNGHYMKKKQITR